MVTELIHLATQALTRQALALVGRSDALRLIEADIKCAARSDAKVLITGETGVGKEIVARLIHERSARASAPLVTLNCAGLPDSLLQSELFGHVKGSFTGAHRDSPGRLDGAANGTLVLDEVGEMSLRMQSALLRFLETGEIHRVGSHQATLHVDVRLIAATNRDLQQQIIVGAFREDLYYRLNVIQVAIPPLRDRVEDIPPLVEHWVRLLSTAHGVTPPEIAHDAMGALLAYRWPGNVREMKNIIERLILKRAGALVRLPDLPTNIVAQSIAEAAGVRADDRRASSRSRVEQLLVRMLDGGESFWSTVHPAFMAHDLTRDDLRDIVRVGLESVNGNYRLLVQRFHMPSTDYKRFLSFLRKHGCHLPFEPFRVNP